MFEGIGNAAEATIKVCAALIVVKCCDKMGLFDPVKKWWKETTQEKNITLD